MKRFVSAASIGQFREVVANINRTANFVGLDKNGEAIYDPSLKKPSILFLGTVKTHGTYSSFCYNHISGHWYQSKNNIITPEKDNAGFAWFAETKKEVFIELVKKLAEQNSVDLNHNSISLGAEWAGEGIQKGVGITNLEKSAFIFSHAKVAPFDGEKSSYWIPTNKVDSPENKIYNLENFKTYTIEVDFNNPQLFQNKIIEMTIEVEEECPVAKEFGFSGIGEGIVFSHLNEDGSRYIFKSKGTLHSKSKVKTLKLVDDVKINKCIQIAEQVTLSWRLEQMLTETFDLINGGVIDRKRLGDYLRAVINDVIKEESDIISDAGLEIKDVGKYISQIARDYFFQVEKDDFDVS